MNGLANFQGAVSIANRQMIVDFAGRHRLPAVYQATRFAQAGGLMAWAPNQEEQYRIAAGYVDQILKGASPGDLPIRHPRRYFWTLNQAAASEGSWTDIEPSGPCPSGSRDLVIEGQERLLRHAPGGL